MKNIYLRSDYSVKKISLFILISLLPLIAGGFYKNGIKLFNSNLTGMYGAFKPLIFSLSGLLIGILVNIIYEYLIKKQREGFIDTVFSSFHPIYGLLIASVISINTNLLLFVLVTFLLLFASKFIKTTKINIPALGALLIILIMSLSSNFTFLNAYESSRVLNLDTLDYLIGKGSGGINTAYVIFLLFSLIILANQEFYKKSIPLFSSIVFALLITIYSGLNNNIGLVLDHLLTSGILFSFVYLGTEPLSSAYTKKGKIIFGVLIGLITFGLFLIYPPLSALGAILIVSLLHDFIDNIS